LCKVCSVFVPDRWRDTFVVAQSWPSRACQDYAIKVKATRWQLGCMTDMGLKLASGSQSVLDAGPVPPDPNCWK
jgi:hypothetical protein